MSVREISRNPIITQSPPTPGTEPTLASTGPRFSATTTITGSYTLSAGQAISGYHITGTLYLNGANCSATDCTIDGGIDVNQRPGGNYGVPAVAGQLVAYCTAKSINSIGTGGVEVHHCQFGSATTFAGTVVTWQRDPARNLCQFVNFHDNYVFGTVSAGAGSGHYEVMHLEGCTDSAFTYNHFEWYPPDAATDSQTTGLFNMSVDQGPNPRNTFSNNWCYGGGPYYSLYQYFTTGTVFTNNAFHSYTTGGGAHKVPALYSKANFTAGGTSMTNWVDPTSATCFGNTIDGAPWDVVTAVLS